MSLIALLAVLSVTTDTAPALVLERVRSVDDPRVYDLRDPVHGDRGVPVSCAPSDGISVTLQLGRDATLVVDRGGATKSIVVENTAALGRSTLACGTSDDFYYANPRLGKIFAYSASRLLRGEDPVVWSRQLDPFTSLDDAKGIMTDASVATALQVRQQLVLVEWFFRQNGKTGFWHEVFDATTGEELEKIGPSDLLLKLNESDPWWIAFQGGGNETANYIPQNIYRLAYRAPADEVERASVAIETLRKSSIPRGLHAIASLSPNPVINHMIALLSPTRTSGSAAIEFCPTVPGQRARYWLGGDYDETLATVARNVLLAYWAERQREGAVENPIESWFQSAIAPREPMKSLLTRFNPHDDAWIVAFQQALLRLGGPTLESWIEKYGTAAGVTRTSSERGAR